MQQNEAPPQQKAPIVRVCWDELFDFMRGWFAKTAPILEKPIFELNRYSGVLGAWQKVVEWKVTGGSRGELKEISVICDSYTTLKVRIIVAGLERTDKQLQTALTLPYQDLKLISGQVVVVFCKSDGATAIVFDACIIGKEIVKL
ncbi:unnamed protein product [marine sediment metagenome]|uniref:Uncharacterized protein n=1 Tax=marine sediment metagenome TaxID=412755 RepID=X1RGP0_9ZZZZ